MTVSRQYHRIFLQAHRLLNLHLRFFEVMHKPHLEYCHKLGLAVHLYL
jgi:hypothetical protein